jgi:DNA-binding FrmR family transcriptional regulator
MTGHPDHSVHKKRLNRVRGQINGIEKMIEARRYCPDIIIQLKAVSKALEAVSAEIMKTHVHACVRAAIKSKDEKDITAKIKEIMSLVK